MNRTKDRVLVRGNLSSLHAFTFASLTGIVGVGTLYFFVNPLTAALGGNFKIKFDLLTLIKVINSWFFKGATTLFLYTAIYTPMKRLSALNTWVGSIVGAIPPIMGYIAMIGHIEPGFS